MENKFVVVGRKLVNQFAGVVKTTEFSTEEDALKASVVSHAASASSLNGIAFKLRRALDCGEVRQ